MATPGMRAMDLEMRMHETGARVPFINAAAHALFFYLSWFFPPVFLVSLVDAEKRCLHDILAGVVLRAPAVIFDEKYFCPAHSRRARSVLALRRLADASRSAKA